MRSEKYFILSLKSPCLKKYKLNTMQSFHLVKFVKSKIVNRYIDYHRLTGKTVIHFIHIGKTAGTAIRVAFAEESAVSGNVLPQKDKLFLMHGHGFKFTAAGDREKVFFVVRNPLERFVSGFYSRMREGKPKNYNPWNAAEKEAFTNFSTPNELGEALSSSNVGKQEAAKAALNGIGHVNTSYWDWFQDPEHLKKNSHKILKVLRQEQLNEDFEAFCREFDLSISGLPSDNIKSHRTPDKYPKGLSKEATVNLKKWYNKEYHFLECLYEMGFLDSSYISKIRQ